MSKNNKEELLKILEDYPFGLTISELSEKSRLHRNTVSKYLNVLEVEKFVNKKEIGRAQLYFTSKRKYLRRDLVNSFLKALLHGFKQKFGDTSDTYKEVGHILVDNFQFPIGEKYSEEFKRAKKTQDPIPKLKLFQHFYNSFDLFQDDLDISLIKLDKKEVIYRLKNSEFLDLEGKYITFFYIAFGITEAIYKENLKLDIKCDLIDYHFSKKDKNGYLDISLKLNNS